MSIFEELSLKFNNKKCDVLGFGTSNRPLVELLVSFGAIVTVRDKKEKVLQEEITQKLISQKVCFITGDSYLENISGDYIFRSPGIRADNPEILSALSRGAILTSEMELFFEVCPCKIIGITGSDGKTTTTTITHLLLDTEFKKEGKRMAYVGGNIGQPLLPLVNEMNENDVAVVELSSFQLQTMRNSPSRSLITNITPNHLDWHVDMNEYIDAKRNIYSHGSPEFLAVNAENRITREIGENADLPIVYFSSKKNKYSDIVSELGKKSKAIYEDEKVIYIDDGENRKAIIKSSDILLAGRHNVENYMAAIALTDRLVSRDTVEQVAKTFRGVPHRLELVRELNRVRYYNSSIDSSPTRTEAAIKALDKRPIIICGGYDKNIPFDTLARALCSSVKSVILTGATAQKIFDEILKCEDYSEDKLKVEIEPDFDKAVLRASEQAESGDIVLLSPACASFDVFQNFEKRGERFKELINNLE